MNRAAARVNTRDGASRERLGEQNRGRCRQRRNKLINNVFSPQRGAKGAIDSWRKCHKKTKNVGVSLIAIYLHDGTRISRTRTLIGGFLPTSWHGLRGAEPRGKFEARVWGLGNFSGKVEMDMFGGLTKTSSRIAIAAALGLTLGGFAFKATPAQAADLGGDCCADLEERVAELEATTVRKGNKKVSVTLSGWVVKTMNWWDDGDEDSFAVADKTYDIGTRFAITGSAQIAPGWSGGFNITVLTQGTDFGLANQFDNFNGLVGFGCNNGGTLNRFCNDYGDLATLYSYIYIKSDHWGALNWGHLSPASDNPAVLADLSGTVIESNGVFFEGGNFLLRPSGRTNNNVNKGLSDLGWGNFLTCQGLGAGFGVD